MTESILKKRKLGAGGDSNCESARILALSDLPDDMIRYIGVILCPLQVYNVWNVLARLNRHFEKRMQDPPMHEFDTVEIYTIPEAIFITYYRCGEIHRDGGLPAMTCSNGTKQWWVNGKLHRDGGLPAVESSNGTKEWWVNGNLHRDGDLPAVDHAAGAKKWWVHGKRHRDGGLPAVEYKSGTKEWWVNGKRCPDVISISE